MVRGARYAYLGLAWLFLAGVVLQVFFIGLALFVGSENFALHRDFGYILQLVPILVLVAALVARAGRTRILQAVSLVAVIVVFPTLPLFRDSVPVIAAFHPIGALLGFWIGIVVVRGASSLLRDSDAPAERASAPA
jgi:Family of unknown function (DUF6220)